MMQPITQNKTILLRSVAMWDSRGGPRGFKRWPHHRDVWCDTLFHVALCSTHHISNKSIKNQ